MSAEQSAQSKSKALNPNAGEWKPNAGAAEFRPGQSFSPAAAGQPAAGMIPMYSPAPVNPSYYYPPYYAQGPGVPTWQAGQFSPGWQPGFQPGYAQPVYGYPPRGYSMSNVPTSPVPARVSPSLTAQTSPALSDKILSGKPLEAPSTPPVAKLSPSLTPKLAPAVADPVLPPDEEKNIAAMESLEVNEPEKPAELPVTEPEPEVKSSEPVAVVAIPEIVEPEPVVPTPEPDATESKTETLLPTEENAVVEEDKASGEMITPPTTDSVLVSDAAKPAPQRKGLVIEETVSQTEGLPVPQTSPRPERGSGKGRNRDHKGRKRENDDEDGGKITRTVSSSSVASDWSRNGDFAPNYVVRPPLENLSRLLQLKDDVRRYDKLRLLTLYSKPTAPSRHLKDLYGRIVSAPRVPRGCDAAKQIEDEEISKLQAALFAKAKAPSSVNPETADAEISVSARTIKTANLILNKISPTTFEKLSSEFVTAMAPIHEDAELMSRIIELIVDKAQLEESFCFMYANLCKLLSDSSPPVPTQEGENPPTGASGQYRQELLNKCRDFFAIKRAEKILEIRALDIPDLDKEVKEATMKRRYTGHIRFIGEIYMLGMISGNVILSCTDELLALKEEEDIVCFCKLMGTVGQQFEAKPLSASKQALYESQWDTVRQLATSHPVSRVRFMLKDLIDLRANRWQARREELKAVKLSELRGETPVSSAPVSRQQSADEWTTVPGKEVKSKPGSSRTAASTASGRPAGNPWAQKPGTPSTPGRTFDARKQNLPSGSTLASGSHKGGLQRQSSQDSLNGDRSRGGFNSGSSGSGRGSYQPKGLSRQPDVKSQGQISPPPQAVLQEEIELSTSQSSTVRNSVEEYLSNDLLEEVVIVLQEHNLLPSSPSVGTTTFGGGISRLVLDKIVDSPKEASRKKLGRLLSHLCGGSHIGDAGPPTASVWISQSSLQKSILSLLGDLGDIIIDAPKAASFLGEALGNLVYDSLLPLEFLDSWPNSLQVRGEVIGPCLALLGILLGHPKAKLLIEKSRLDFRTIALEDAKAAAEPDTLSEQEAETVKSDFVKKFNLSWVFENHS